MEEAAKEYEQKKPRIAVQTMARIGLMVAVIEVSKWVLAYLPNVELTTFWLILFTLYFGRQIVLVVPVFVLIEGVTYGFGLWWFMYLYMWPLLVGVTWFFRRQESVWFWSLLSGGFGLLFGLLCSLAYLITGLLGGDGFMAAMYSAFAWWVSGIPWDIVHCMGNFVLMLVLYTPVRHVMRKLK